jgi:hypothetical protein
VRDAGDDVVGIRTGRSSYYNISFSTLPHVSLAQSRLT